MALGLVGTVAPSLVAVALTARTEGRAAVGALLGRIFLWDVGARWYVFAVGYIAAIKLGVAVVHRAATGAWPVFGHTRWYLLIVATIFSTPVQAGEEVGWRGYALPRLRERIGPLGASLVIGVLWTLWHVPMLTLQGITEPKLYPVFLALMTGGSVLFTWIYQHTRGSLLLAVLAHVGTHLDNPGHALPARATPIALHALALVALAVALVAFDRGAFRRLATS